MRSVAKIYHYSVPCHIYLHRHNVQCVVKQDVGELQYACQTCTYIYVLDCQVCSNSHNLFFRIGILTKFPNYIIRS